MPGVFHGTEEDNAAWLCESVTVVFISLWKINSLHICWTLHKVSFRIFSNANVVHFIFIQLLHLIRDDIYQKCYAVGCTERQRQGTENFFRFPRNPEWYIHKIIEQRIDHLFIYHIMHSRCQREFINFYILTLVSSLNVLSCVTIRRAAFFAWCSFRIWQIQNSDFIKQIKHIKCSLLRTTQIWTVPYVEIIILSFIYSFTVQNFGPRRLAACAQWRTLGSWNSNFCAEITSCRQTSWHLKGYTSTVWYFNVAFFSFLPAISKSAQIPFSSLPAAIDVPTSVSVLVYFSTLVNFRCFFINSF